MASKVKPAAYIMLSVLISMGFISAHLDQANDKDFNHEASPKILYTNMEEAQAPGDPKCSPGCVPGDIVPTQTVSMLSGAPPSPKTTYDPMCGTGCLPACVPVWDNHVDGPLLFCYGSDRMPLRNFKSDHRRYAAVRSADVMNEAINYITSEPTRPPDFLDHSQP